MANIGSAFLGDLQAKRIRHLSSPPGSAGAISPPSSPPATTLENSNRMNISQPLSIPSPQQLEPPSRSQRDEQLGEAWDTLAQPPSHKAIVDPVLALELRVRWLEALVLGVSGPTQTLDSSTSANTTDKRKPRFGGEKGQKGRGNIGSLRGKGSEKPKGREKDRGKGKESVATLARLTEDVTKRLNAIVETNEGLRKFMDTYDQHAQYLTPTFALSGIIDVPLPSTPTSDNPEGAGLSSSLLPLYGNMSPEELEAYLAEMEPDVRAADRDMLEIETLVRRGVTGAGKLGGYESLRPRLANLIKEHEEDARLAHDLERRVARLVERHVTQVDALSELFVAWDDTLLEAESRTNKLEKEARERQRLGLEPQLPQA